MDGISNNNLSTKVNNDESTRKSSSNGFSVDDFFQLFAAQLQNQDMMNPVDDSQFLAQMAQITTLQTMQQMNELTLTSYAFEFMGKEVVVTQESKTGEMESIQGMVEKVSLYSGKPQVYVKGNAYELSQVMEILAPKVDQETETK